LSEEREVPTADGQKLANKLGCPFFEVSAKTNENVTAAFEKLAQLIYDARHKGTNSNTNNKKSKRK
jgi:GTPase SAR1 family protein